MVYNLTAVLFCNQNFCRKHPLYKKSENDVTTLVSVSYTHLNRIRIHSLAEQGNKRAIILEKIISNSGKMLSTILIGNNIVNIAASSLATTFTMKVFGSMYIGVATGVMTLLVLLFGEITPKTIATLKADDLALTYARPIYALMTVLTPVIYIVGKLANGILSVSYTHLDVYKRQSPSCAATTLERSSVSSRLRDPIRI